jgi:iron(III) transport system substrate-binding protein
LFVVAVNPSIIKGYNNEISRTLKLKDAGVLAPYKSPSAKDIPDNLKDPDGFWTAFSARARVIVYNTNKVKGADIPKSIFDLTNPKWKGKVAFANPAAGTTASHASAIFLHLGEEKAVEFFKKLKKNGARMVRSNSQVRDLVANGSVLLGLTDTDDVWVGIGQKKPVAMVYPDAASFGTLVIPNSAMLIKGGPNPDEAKKFIDFLLSRKTEELLAKGRARQIPVRGGVPVPKGVKTLGEIKAMDLRFERISKKMKHACDKVREIFED